MAIVADSAGKVRAQFTIPADIPAGSKSVVITGRGGSHGEATFVGRGTIVEQELRQVTYQVVPSKSDPLAQTFSLNETRQVAGVDIYVTRKGSAALKNSIRVQIRGVSVGFPTSEVFAEGEVAYDDLKMSPAATRVTWVPTLLEAGRTYALVVLTDDAEHAVAIAELGKFDSNKQQWVAAQPYQVGVLLSSSNAETWTAHQDKDLRFRLLAAKYTATTRKVELSTTPATAATDIVMLAGVDRPVQEADLHFEAKLADGSVLRMAEQQAVSLATAYSGNMEVSAVLKGSEKFSPVLYDGVQVVKGKQDASNDYYTRAIPCSGSSRITVTFDKLTTGTATIVAQVQKDGAGEWQDVPFINGTPVGDGYVEVKHELTGVNPTGFIRVRLVLTGSAANRPRAKNLRVIVV